MEVRNFLKWHLPMYHLHVCMYLHRWSHTILGL